MTKRSLVHRQKLRPTSRYMAMNDMNLSTLNNSIKKHVMLGPVEAEGGKVKDNFLPSKVYSKITDCHGHRTVGHFHTILSMLAQSCHMRHHRSATAPGNQVVPECKHILS